MRKRYRVANVVCFRLSTRGILVYEHDLATHTLHHECIPGGCAHESTPYNSYFHHRFPLWSNFRWITKRLGVLCLDEQRPPLLSALAQGPPGIRDEGGAVRHPVHTQEGFRWGCSG